MQQPDGKPWMRAFLYGLSVPRVPRPLLAPLGTAVLETLPLRTGRRHDVMPAPSISWRFGELVLFS